MPNARPENVVRQPHTRQLVFLEACASHRSVPAPRHVSCAASRSSSTSEQRSAPAGFNTPVAPSKAPKQAKGVIQLEIAEKDLPKSRKQFTVTIPATSVRKFFDAAVKEFRETQRPSGFRKGSKIPDDILFRSIDGGLNTVKETALEQLLHRSLPQVLAKYDALAYSDSLQVDSPQDELVAAFDVKKPLTFSVSIDIAPVLSWREPYKQIEIEVDAPSNEEDNAVSVEKMIRRFRKDHGTMRIVQGRGLQRGDMARCSFDATTSVDGKPIPGAAQSNMNLDTATSDDTYIPGLAAGLEGMVVGDSRVVPIVFPDDWVPEQLANMKADCSVTLKELFVTELAELDNELVKKHIPDCDNVDDFQSQLMEATQLEAAAQMHHLVVDSLAIAVAERVVADLPESVIHSTGQQEFQAHLIRLQQEDKIAPEMIAQLATEPMMNNYIDHNRERIERVSRSIMGFESIFQEEGLRVSENDVREEMQRTAQQFESSGTEYDEERLQEQAIETCKGNATLEFLQSVCSITVNPKV